MDRAYAAGAIETPPAPPAAPSVGYPTSGNPGSGLPATKPGDYWFHMVTEELRNLLLASGQTPSHEDLLQVARAVQFGAGTSAVAGGTANAITATFLPAITALRDGLLLHVCSTAANTVTEPTFTPAPGVIGALPIVKVGGAALAAGDIAGVGHWISLRYDADLDKWLLTNPATAGITLAQGDARWAAEASMQTAYFDAGGVQYRLTGGATPVLFEMPTHKLTRRALEFDAATVQYAQIGFNMPKGWNKGPVKLRFVWSAVATGGVRWGAQGRALANGDALDAAWGTAQEVNDSLPTANTRRISPLTGDIVLDVSPQDEDSVVLQVYRKADDVTNDTNGAKARLLGIVVKYSTASLNDA